MYCNFGVIKSGLLDTKVLLAGHFQYPHKSMFASNALLGGGVRVWIRKIKRRSKARTTKTLMIDGKLGHHSERIW